ncbi:MAG: 50S ribosomal protein L20 [Holosporales bacterium]|jgi:large subunit ribosomal protein L20|nr:50S ribosomal protein L20 [Holosporales bacterium]
MARVKRGVTAHARHRKVLSLTKGFRGRSSTCFRIAIEKLEKSWQYAYRDRKNKKREMRGLWIQRINAAVRCLGMKYSTFINGLTKLKVSLDRKVLAKLAVEDPNIIKELVAKIQLNGAELKKKGTSPKKKTAEESVDSNGVS